MSFSTRTMTAQDWIDLATKFGRAYFAPSEFKNPERMGYEFMLWLFEVRIEAGVPMVSTSGYRDPWYNKFIVKGAKNSAHTDLVCDASDFGSKGGYVLTNEYRFHIVRAAIKLGCVRIGIYKNGSLHLDRTEDRRPANRLWTVVK